jgi:hypothetical protein
MGFRWNLRRGFPGVGELAAIGALAAPSASLDGSLDASAPPAIALSQSRTWGGGAPIAGPFGV